MFQGRLRRPTHTGDKRGAARAAERSQASAGSWELRACQGRESSCAQCSQEGREGEDCAVTLDWWPQ